MPPLFRALIALTTLVTAAAGAFAWFERFSPDGELWNRWRLFSAFTGYWYDNVAIGVIGQLGVLAVATQLAGTVAAVVSQVTRSWMRVAVVVSSVVAAKCGIVIFVVGPASAPDVVRGDVAMIVFVCGALATGVLALLAPRDR